ncbi:protein of unknown function [Blastococcus aggregatus]|uniref:DUF4262 domain-containing protein n=1 Tax=Blastococcus aggregatus TaxID=38502 RepID=A0A285UXE4_9ACTN|nr:DUF4262 domain-containing protein [Blastococcus aggregatus]SOC46479.1 protein of unknown function [Blastococcus aggregatus]
MTQDAQTIAWLDQEDARLAQLIRRHGWAVQYVSADEEEEPSFAYTVGLFGLGHPELVVVGVGYDTACGLLNRVGDMVLDGRDLVAGEVIRDDDGVPVLAVEVLPNAGEVLFSANRFYQRPDEFSVPAYQLTWALPGGIFPWDHGYACEPGCQPRPGEWRA